MIFWALTNVKFVDLSHNEILFFDRKSICRGVRRGRPGLSNVEQLNLGYNNISSVHENAFHRAGSSERN